MVKQEKEVGVGNLIGKAKARQSTIIIKMKKGIEQLANLWKNINTTLGKLRQQSKRPLQGYGMAAISKSKSFFKIFRKLD